MKTNIRKICKIKKMGDWRNCSKNWSTLLSLLVCNLMKYFTVDHLVSLRTSDTAYLRESFIFYDAIRNRGYFKDLIKEGR